MRTSMAKLRVAFLQLLKTITLKTLACWRTDMTSTLCINLATHFVRMPSSFIIFMLPFSAVALAPARCTLISAMADGRTASPSEVESCLHHSHPSRTVHHPVPPHSGSTWNDKLHTLWCFMFHWCWCSFVVDTDRFSFTKGNCTFVNIE
jgi:hypothetical protein